MRLCGSQRWISVVGSTSERVVTLGWFHSRRLWTHSTEHACQPKETPDICGSVSYTVHGAVISYTYVVIVLSSLSLLSLASTCRQWCLTPAEENRKAPDFTTGHSSESAISATNKSASECVAAFTYATVARYVDSVSIARVGSTVRGSVDVFAACLRLFTAVLRSASARIRRRRSHACRRKV